MIFNNLLVDIRLFFFVLFVLICCFYYLVKLKDTIDKCFTCLDPDTVQQSSQLLETTHESLLKIIRQQSRILSLFY